MSANKNSLSLHPAADVFRSHLLAEVSEENEVLEKKIERLEEARHFGSVELQLKSGDVETVSMRTAFVIEDFAGLPTLRVRAVDATPRPISEFRSGQVTMAGQRVGSLPGVQAPIFVSRNSVSKTARMKLVVSMGVIVEGELGGLHRKDFALFKDEAYGEELLARFMMSGKGLRNPQSVEFTPQAIYVAVRDDFRETIRVLGITGRIESLENCKPLPVDPQHLIECPPPSPSDEARRKIVKALGSADQLELLEKNVELKDVHYRFSKVEEKIDSVHIISNLPEMKSPPFSLNDGRLVMDAEGRPVWSVSLQLGGTYCPVIDHALDVLDISVSGVVSGMESCQIHSESGDFVVTFGSGAKVVGVVEGAEGFDQMVKPFLKRGALPPGLALATEIQFPLDIIGKTLDVLGVDYANEEGTGNVDIGKATDMLQALRF